MTVQALFHHVTYTAETARQQNLNNKRVHSTESCSSYARFPVPHTLVFNLDLVWCAWSVLKNSISSAKHHVMTILDDTLHPGQ
jgi:hypothetical protein